MTPRKRNLPAKTLPLNFLLGCSQGELSNFELARLAEVADLRKELHAILDRVIDAMSQAALTAWFRSQDRNSLKHAIENEETPLEWAQRMISQGQRSEEELIPLPAMEPGAAHRAAALRYQERNIAEGKCRYCPKPLDRNSVDMCTKHLGMARNRARQKKGIKGDPGSRDYLYGEISESKHGRQSGTLASLAMHREQKTRALLAELGIPPENAAITLEAAKEALLKAMPQSQKEAMTQAELREAATVPSRQTTVKALNQLLNLGHIQRIGKGGMREPCRYWRKAE